MQLCRGVKLFLLITQIHFMVVSEASSSAEYPPYFAIAIDKNLTQDLHLFARYKDCPAYVGVRAEYSMTAVWQQRSKGVLQWHLTDGVTFSPDCSRSLVPAARDYFVQNQTHLPQSDGWTDYTSGRSNISIDLLPLNHCTIYNNVHFEGEMLQATVESFETCKDGVNEKVKTNQKLSDKNISMFLSRRRVDGECEYYANVSHLKLVKDSGGGEQDSKIYISNKFCTVENDTELEIETFGKIVDSETETKKVLDSVRFDTENNDDAVTFIVANKTKSPIDDRETPSIDLQDADTKKVSGGVDTNSGTDTENSLHTALWGLLAIPGVAFGFLGKSLKVDKNIFII